MKTILLDLYKFEELGNTVKKKIIEERRYELVENDYWYEATYDLFIKKMRRDGFEVDEIMHTKNRKFNAYFTGQVVDNEVFFNYMKDIRPEIAELLKMDTKELSIKMIKTEDRRALSYLVVSVFVETDNEEIEEKYKEELEKIEDILTNYKDAACDYLARNLAHEYISLTHDDTFSKFIEEEDRYYTKYGRLFLDGGNRHERINR